ncbi:sterol desaturase family protein [Marinilongibacter aquaticus]|uniref:sterol desaturase family protein n=1 Tax=Marinilongibacter aquaticus TaxID=2975157 RepID=UPI0021BD2398|nr:sterol desaturase family protein [Marinilongibacter aquaticus]UBM59865.1 sterol desaturase family protein [Marinilongibacter aquaticus]
MLHFLAELWQEILGFLGITNALKILNSGDYSSFLTYDGVLALINPLLPLLLVLELLLGLIHKKPQAKVYRTNFLIYIFNRIVGRYLAIGMVAVCIGLFSKYAPFSLGISFWGLVIGYIIWEFSHFIYHYLGHKVRLFWCLHATHHTPEDMNLSVSYAHFFLEAPYADTIRTSICILCGVSPTLLFLIMFIDGTYGGFIHVGENLLKKGKLGFLSKFILTPQHHRIHHARNPLYVDTNFCNLLNIWDRVFKTYQEEDPSLKIEYGITRQIDSSNFGDVYFSEITALAKDVWQAPGLKNKLLYILMPPGWSHLGEHKTARIMREEYLGLQQETV